MIRSILLTVILMLLLPACKPVDTGDRFVGSWIDIHDSRHALVIEKNGANFMISEFHAACQACTNLVKEDPVPSQYQDGMLRVSGPFGAMTLDIAKSTGHLVTAGGEFKPSPKK